MKKHVTKRMPEKLAIILFVSILENFDTSKSPSKCKQMLNTHYFVS